MSWSRTNIPGAWRASAVVLALVAALLVVPPSAGAQTQDPYKPYVPSGDAKDKTKPRLTKVTLTPRVARASAQRTLRFRLSEAARVTGEVMLHKPGARTKGGRCLQRTSRRRGRDCMRRVRVGRLLAARAARGANRARLDVRDLAPGDYTLVLTPKDAAGNRGAARSIAFRVLRAR